MFGRNREPYREPSFFEQLQRHPEEGFYAGRGYRYFDISDDKYLHLAPDMKWEQYNGDFLREHEKAKDTHERSIDCFCGPTVHEQKGELLIHNNISRVEAEQNKKLDIALENFHAHLESLNFTEREELAAIALTVVAKPISLPGQHMYSNFVVLLRDQEDRKAFEFGDLTILIEKDVVQLVDFATDLGTILEVFDPQVFKYIQELNS